MGVYTKFTSIYINLGLACKIGTFWDQIWTLVPFGTKSQIWDFIRAPAFPPFPLCGYSNFHYKLSQITLVYIIRCDILWVLVSPRTTSFTVIVAPRAWCFQPRSSHVYETGVGARLRCSCTLSTQPVLKCTSDGIEHCTVFGGWFKGHVCIVVARDNSQLIHRAFSSRQKSFVPQYRIGSFPRAIWPSNIPSFLGTAITF